MRIARFLLIVAFGTSLSAVSGCGDPGVWDREPEKVLEDLSAGRHAFLQHLEPEALRNAEIFRLHEGAGYLLGRVYEDLGQSQEAYLAYQRQIESGTEPYRRAALSAVFALYTQGAAAQARDGGEDARDAGEDARDGGEDVGTGETRAIVPERRLAEWAVRTPAEYPEEPALHLDALAALYEAGAFESYLDLLGDDRLSDELGGRSELVLMSAVARFELDREGWKEGMRRLFGEFAARRDHSRLFLYLHAKDDASTAFSEAEHRLFEAKHALVEGRFRDAAEHFRQLRPGELPQSYRNGVLARDMGRAFVRARYYTVGDELLGALTETIAEDALPALSHERAQLAMAAGNTAAARETLEALLGRRREAAPRSAEAPSQSTDAAPQSTDAAPEGAEALGSAADPALKRAVFGDYLDVLSRSAVDRIPTALRAHRSLWRTAGSYSRFFEGLTHELVRSRDWFLLADLVEVLEANGRSVPAEQYRLVLAAALDADLFQPDPESGFAERRAVLEPLREARRPYYRLMGRILLGENPAAAMEADLTGSALPGDADSARALKLARGYLAFGLTERAYELTRTYGETFPGEFVEEAARRAAAEGNLITAIRLAGRVRSEEFRRELAELRYPLGFAADVDAVVEMYGLDGAIFYGLIREESHFSASIVSHAGAVGLAQLMPATARDVARRMRLGDYELTDPATNLALGAHYLAYLKGRFPTYLHALAAYNGGQGRVRRWMERFGLDGILFHEAIPLLETRHYVRKVVVSAAYYGYLYDDREPAEIVQPIFPNVGARSSAERRNPGGTPGS